LFLSDDFEVLNFMKTKGNAPVSFVSILLEEADMTPEKEFELKWSAASLYSGAADTVSTIIPLQWISLRILN
jgi:hypothetical protein